MGVLVVLGDIAIFAQLSGLHIAMLIALAARLLRIPQCEAECSRLEESMRRMRAMLRWPWPAAALDAADVALAEADGLVDSYRRSTLWRRVRTSRSVEAALQDARDGIDCLLVLLLCAHANNIVAVHPASATNHHVISDPSHGAEACDGASDGQSYNATSQGVADDQSHNSEPGGFESAV